MTCPMDTADNLGGAVDLPRGDALAKLRGMAAGGVRSFVAAKISTNHPLQPSGEVGRFEVED